jgi:hypothetical protein
LTQNDSKKLVLAENIGKMLQNVNGVSYKYLQLQIFVTFGGIGTRSSRRSQAEALIATEFYSGLPDFSWYMIPKPEKMYQMNTECTKMVIKYPKSP